MSRSSLFPRYPSLLNCSTSSHRHIPHRTRTHKFRALPLQHISSYTHNYGCSSPSQTPPSYNKPFPPGTSLTSTSGQAYKIEELLSNHSKTPLHVYLASANGTKYIMKTMIKGEFEYQLHLQGSLSSCQNVRTVIDTVPEHEVFVYRYLAGDLLRLSQNKKFSQHARRANLRDALKGLVNLHDRDIVHNDIKPNNILIDYDEEANDQITVKDVMISDLEDTVIVPRGKWLRGPLCGNAIWRSPESWCRSRQNQASDVFSFGIVMIYVMVNEMVFRVSDDQLNAADSWRYVLQRHLSYFADEDGLNGLLQHIGEDNPFFERLISLVDSFVPGDLRQPFKVWDYVDPDLRELVSSMTNLDPVRRISAREALGHSWFNQTSRAS